MTTTSPNLEATFERLGSGYSGGIVAFRVVSEHVITPDEAVEIQKGLGFHPAGYGTGMPRSVKHNDGVRWVTTWSCSASCD